MIHGISGCGVVGACGEGRGDVRLGRGDQEMICERAASGVVSFLSFFSYLVSSSTKVVELVVGEISQLARALFYLLCFYFSHRLALAV